MSHSTEIAVVGAGSLCGETFLDLLAAAELPVGRVRALTAGDRVGDEVGCGNVQLEIGDARRFDFARAGVVLFFGDAALARELAPRALDAGCRVIDGSGAFIDDAQVPLIVSGVNSDRMPGGRERLLVASPGNAAVALATVLKPIADLAGLERVDLTSLEPVSELGKAAVDELGRQTADLLSFRDVQPQLFAKTMAFNLLPQVGSFDAEGHGRQERRIAAELQRVLADPSLPVTVTAVQVPVFFGQAAVVHLETTRRLEAASAAAALAAADRITVASPQEAGAGPTPVTEASGSDRIFVGRLRSAASVPHGLNLWLVSDNMRRGTADNCLRMLEMLLHRQV